MRWTGFEVAVCAYALTWMMGWLCLEFNTAVLICGEMYVRDMWDVCDEVLFVCVVMNDGMDVCSPW